MNAKFVFAAALLLAMGSGAKAVGAETPAGIGVRMTVEGPIFVDQHGMSLYWRDSACNDDHTTDVRPIAPEGAVPFQVIGQRPRSCLQKNPPLLARADANPVGAWTILTRADGRRQWAYADKPLHTSIKDLMPGDINGNYPTRLGRGLSHAATAPLLGYPSGTKWRVTALGLALTDQTGRSLYYSEPNADCDATCARTWRPFLAPALASTAGLTRDWSIATREDGLRQWMFGGRAMYTYQYDAPANGEQLFGDTYGGTWGTPIAGWKVALLKPAPRHPAGVTIQILPGDNELFSFGLPKRVYADAKGMTLYTMHCSEGASDEGEEGAIACDDIGDDPRYWLSFCGGEDRCARTWRPLRAPANAQPIDNAWSIVEIGPKDAFKPVAPHTGERVWAYRGHVVFTYAYDALPGDYYGDDNGFGTTGLGQMTARPIPAYGDEPANLPVMQLTTTAKRKAA